MSKKAEIVFEKYAKKGKRPNYFTMENVEDNLGYYFHDKEEPAVRKMVTEQHKKRVALRHPKLTGIPTLGIAPAIAKAKATKEVSRRILKKNRKVLTHYQKNREIKARESQVNAMQKRYYDSF